MSRSLGAELPPDLVARLSRADLPRHLGKVIPLITVDAAGFPHPMLLSSVEARAAGPRTIRIVIGARSRSARNLIERQAATLLVVEPERTFYVKARATDGPHPLAGHPDLALFGLDVEDVLEDAPADWESQMRITAGATYAPGPRLDDPRIRAILEALGGSSPS